MPKIEDVEGGDRVTFQRNNVVKTATENATDIATVKLNLARLKTKCDT